MEGKTTPQQLQTQRCSDHRCHRSSLRPFIESFKCSLCHQIYCLQHRTPEDHHCLILQDKEEQKAETRRKHEQIIENILSAQKICSRNKEAAFQSHTKHVINELVSGSPLTAPQTSSSTLQKVKIRMKSVGDSAVPSYDRCHVRVVLKDGVLRGDVTSPGTRPAILPSQKQHTKPGKSNGVNATSDLYVWLDKTKSVGWCLDFLTKYFKLFSVDELKLRLYLGRCINEKECVQLPYERLVEDVLVDGDLLHLCRKRY